VYELLAIAAGVIVGLAAHNTDTKVAKGATLILGSITIGAVAAYVSGELLESWAFLVFDVAQVLFVSCATAVLAALWRARVTRLR
jgi:uncharacterized membrane protein YeaQ/YmgE (transglycosylase-associated protein family)